MVEGIRGHTYEKPVPAMRAYLEGIAKGEAGSDYWPLAIAALGPLMLKLSASHTRGALPYNTTPQHTAEAARILGPNKWLVAEQKVTLETDPTKARALGRKELSRYMVLDNYRNNWLRIGFSEAELANGGSDRFIDAMCCGAPPTRSVRVCGRISLPAQRMSASNRCTRTATPPTRDRILTELANT